MATTLPVTRTCFDFVSAAYTPEFQQNSCNFLQPESALQNAGENREEVLKRGFEYVFNGEKEPSHLVDTFWSWFKLDFDAKTAWENCAILAHWCVQVSLFLPLLGATVWMPYVVCSIVDQIENQRMNTILSELEVQLDDVQRYRWQYDVVGNRFLSSNDYVESLGHLADTLLHYTWRYVPEIKRQAIEYFIENYTASHPALSQDPVMLINFRQSLRFLLNERQAAQFIANRRVRQTPLI